MNLLNFVLNAYDVFQEIEKLETKNENSIAEYLWQHKEGLKGALTKENNPKEIAVKLLSSDLVAKTCPELSDFVRKNYTDMKK